MRFRLLLLCLLSFTTSAFANEVYLAIGGSVGAFHTDARIFNPSTTKDIQIQAYLLPPGADNSSVQPVTITVPHRQMLVYNDVVQSLFNSSVPLAAIRLVSSDPFVATQRIYAATSQGTLGQFEVGQDVSTAAKNGVLIQLRSNAAFRTNIGLVNPNGTAANVQWTLYDKNNNVVGTVNNSASFPAQIPPFGVVTPINVSSAFNTGGADLSDAWIGFASDQPLFVYGSVVDNGTTDPTFIPMALDPGGAAFQSTAKTFNVTEQNFKITISPAITANDLKPGDTVTFHITVMDSSHGFELTDPSGTVLLGPNTFSPGEVVDKTFTVTSQGTYNYFCTNPGCGSGHASMFGSFVVGQSSPGGPSY